MKKQRPRGRARWGFLYAVAFLTAFVLSALLKMQVDPLGGKYAVSWDETVGRVYTDLAYG